MYTEVKKRPGAPRTIFFVGGSDWVVADNTVTGWVRLTVPYQQHHMAPTTRNAIQCMSLELKKVLLGSVRGIPMSSSTVDDLALLIEHSSGYKY